VIPASTESTALCTARHNERMEQSTEWVIRADENRSAERPLFSWSGFCFRKACAASFSQRGLQGPRDPAGRGETCPPCFHRETKAQPNEAPNVPAASRRGPQCKHAV